MLYFNFPSATGVRNYTWQAASGTKTVLLASTRTLGNMMREISAKAMLSKVYTNHCVRATAITLWSEAGLSDRHICHISGHRNPNSLQHYNSRPSSSQLRKCSDVLSSALQEANQSAQESSSAQESFSAQESSTSTITRNEMLGGMFSSCNIHSLSVQINMNMPPSTKE